MISHAISGSLALSAKAVSWRNRAVAALLVVAAGDIAGAVGVVENLERPDLRASVNADLVLVVVLDVAAIINSAVARVVATAVGVGLLVEDLVVAT